MAASRYTSTQRYYSEKVAKINNLFSITPGPGILLIFHSPQRQLTARGKKFSLPAPKGGKHAVRPILTRDDLMGRGQQVTKMARAKTNAMDSDYVAGRTKHLCRFFYHFPYLHHLTFTQSIAICFLHLFCIHFLDHFMNRLPLLRSTSCFTSLRIFRHGK